MYNNPMARPRTVDRALVRTRRVDLLARPAQYSMWAKKAKSVGMPLSAWIRATLDRAARM